jgi:hypothetical protein
LITFSQNPKLECPDLVCSGEEDELEKKRDEEREFQSSRFKTAGDNRQGCTYEACNENRGSSEPSNKKDCNNCGVRQGILRSSGNHANPPSIHKIEWPYDMAN